MVLPHLSLPQNRGFSPNFYKKLISLSNDSGLKPEDIINVMVLESGGNTSAYNTIGAAGLFQFIPKTLSSLNYSGTSKDFAQEPAETQLDYLRKYMGGKKFKSAAQYYAYHFLPASLNIPGVRNEDPNAIIASPDASPDNRHIPIPNKPGKYYSSDFERKVWAQNSPLRDGGGPITYGSLEKALNKAKSYPIYSRLIQQLSNSTGYKPGDYISPSTSTALTTTAPTPTSSSSKDMLSTIEEYVDKFLNYIKSAEKQNIKLYKKYLPKKSYTIKINGDYFPSIEFSRVLCGLLDEELNINAFTHTDGKNVEVEYSIYSKSSPDYSTLVVKELTDTLSSYFNKIVKNSNLSTNFINKSSSLREISLEEAEENYLKFQSKYR
jgi:hypothetical protein